MYRQENENSELIKTKLKFLNRTFHQTNFLYLQTILQVCERIPTMGTQLSILCTVKATMLGCQATEEDQNATDMLEGNAKFIMDSIKETIKACESASIKIRSDAGVRMIWKRKPNWHQLNSGNQKKRFIKFVFIN